MKVFDTLRKNGIFILILVVIIIIVAVTGTIYFLNSSKTIPSNQTVSNSKIGSNLIGYDSLKKQLNSLSQDPSLSSNPSFIKMINYYNVLENKNATKKDINNALSLASNYLLEAYADTDNPKLYNFGLSMDSFVKTNFPTEYKTITFKIPCFDPSCEDAPQDPEIIQIIGEIKSSNIPAFIKEADIKSLTNFSYITKDQSRTKAGDFIAMANSIKYNNYYINAGINIKISDEIINYVKKTFPTDAKYYL